jgi:hypothetical protein
MRGCRVREYARRVRRVLAVLAMAATLVACAADGVSAPTGTAGAGSVPAPAGTLGLVGGSTVDIAEIQSRRPVALWFWAPG